MEFFIIVLLLVLLVLVVRQKSSLTEKISEMENQLTKISSQLTKLSSRIEELQVADKGAEKPSIFAEPVAKPKPVGPVPTVIEKPKEEAKPTPPPATESPVTPVQVQPQPTPLKRRPIPEPEPELSFFERYPDLEKFIGENLVNKIGIAILVLSIGYFVKYAIDSNWIGPVGRVAIGMVAGAILIGVAHRLRQTYNAFSSVLVGGGLAIFYFTIALGFHQFHLFSQLAGLIIMIVITAFAVTLSLLYNKQELAVIALVGGLASPFMLSTGHANYNGLFLYLLILNTGLLVISIFKSWRILNMVSFGLTVIVFSGVLYTLTAPTYFIGFIYATIFYLLFFAINIAYNVRENQAFIASDFSILLINTALYFSAGLWLLTAMNLGIYRGVFTAGLAIINLCLSYILFRNKKVDSNILYLLIGITLTFVSLTAPIQLKGNHITLFWASEAVLLYWLYQKSSIKLIKLSSQIIWIGMLISLLMDWKMIYRSEQIYPVIINKGFVTTLFASLATFLLSFLARRQEDEEDLQIPWNVFQGTALALLFLSGLFEINHQFNTRFPDGDINVLYLMLYIPGFVFLLNLIGSRIRSETFTEEVRAVILAVTIMIYLICEPNYNYLEWQILEERSISVYHFFAHWIAVGIIASLFVQLIKLCLKILNPDVFKVAIWVFCVAIVLFLSLEVNLLSNIIFHSSQHSIARIQNIYIKTGLPVLWGLSSFVIMWMGMNHKNRTLRVVSLSLFSLTLLKLFLFDIRNIPAAGKIVAFFCLGVLLLIVSFMYQKLKQIIVTDEKQTED